MEKQSMGRDLAEVAVDLKPTHGNFLHEFPLLAHGMFTANSWALLATHPGPFTLAPWDFSISLRMVI